MITQQNSLSNLRKSRSFIVLTTIGAILNVIAALTDGNSALVAVGCSLIVVGVATSSKRKRDL
jgi:hypothetical protein